MSKQGSEFTVAHIRLGIQMVKTQFIYDQFTGLRADNVLHLSGQNAEASCVIN